MSAVRARLDDATRQLAAAGIDSPRVDAELLLAHALGIERSRLSTVDGPVPASFGELVERRANREPLQYIVGRTAFRYLDLAVGPGVFVPRPETELLVDAVLPKLGPGPIVVDLCAGSGALALAVADEVPGATVYAVERSAAALSWLRRNASGTKVIVVEGDVADPTLLAALHGRVDTVLSNPPYVPTTTAVAPEVRADPDEAVFAGADGLAVIPAVIARAAQLLRPGGRLALEHDDTHGEAVPSLLRTAGEWHEVADHRDLAGRPRYVTAVRAAAP
ncbi:MAG TPA: peptide chain release factor N(5)-glutamine methyltransferase [Jatrophihabitantaceae bacterium]